MTASKSDEPLSGPAPIASSERLTSIDVLRGVALLGILPINMDFFAFPAITAFNPLVAGGFTGGNFVVWLAGYLLFNEKMITIFSMLFGAGLVLLTDRVQARGRSPAWFFYRRAGVLLLIGLPHAYLIWPGDILVAYAICGMLIYPLRTLKPIAIVIIGLAVMLPPIAVTRSESASFASARDAAIRVESAERRGETPCDSDVELARTWSEIRQGFHPSAAQVEESIHDRRTSSYWQMMPERASAAFFIETSLFATSLVWMISGRMLIGIALMKLGIFEGRRPLRFYFVMSAVGYAVGLPAVALGAYKLVENNFDVVVYFGGGAWFNDFGSLPLALGHIGAVLVIYKTGGMQWLTSRLAAVGRMALSNYLMQSVLCTTLFNGYGFGLFGSLDRVQLLAVVGAIWTFQLWVSPRWLNTFRFGPVEWLWRSLTYGQMQPMRKLRG